MQIAIQHVLMAFLASVISFLGWDSSAFTMPTIENMRIEIKEAMHLDQIDTTPSRASTSSPSTPVLLPKPAPQPVQKVEPKKNSVSTPVPINKKAELEKTVSINQPINLIKVLRPEYKLRDATVNILCNMQIGTSIAHYTGSGVIIDPSGVIITNAHVAMHIMLEQAGHEKCFVRTGSPAANAYKAKIVYLPSAWVYANSGSLSFQNIVGNGENDYAILRITERVSSSAYDIPLPFISPDSRAVSTGDLVRLIGYPLLSQSVSFLDSSLYSLEESGNITSATGYDGRSSDVITTSPTTLATHGSSGGPMISSGGKLIGIMDATIIDSYSGRPAIQGITMSYIDRSLQSHGKSLRALIDNAASEADSFARDQLPTLSTLLMQNAR